MIIGEIAGLSNESTILLSFGLAFAFGYGLSALPLVRGGMSLSSALRLVLAADTVSILTMEIVDNLIMYSIPGAMGAGLVNPLFWMSMSVALFVAFWAAYPVNRALIARGKGHALVHTQHGKNHSDHAHHQHDSHTMDNRPLLYAIIAFLIGGLLVSFAATSFDKTEREHLQHQSSVTR